MGGLSDPVAFRVLQLARATGRRPSEILAGDATEGMIDMRIAAKGFACQNDRIDQALDRFKFDQTLGTESILLLILSLLKER